MSTPFLPYAMWISGTNQNSIPANDNSLRNEIQTGQVLSKATTAQPGSPAEGVIYILPASATGAQWSTFDENDVVIFRGGTWYAFAPTEGMVLNFAGHQEQFDGSDWTPIAGGIASIVAGSNVTVDNTDPANPVISATGGGGGGGSVPAFSDPKGSYWGPSKSVVHGVSGQIVGDPFIVYDGTNYVMYFFVTGSSPTIKTQYKTAPTLEELAAATATDLGGLTNYHKFVLLVDSEGVPVVIGGEYHGYAVKYLTGISDKEIYHFTCSTLTGTWTLGSKVIAKGSSGDKDEFNSDTPYAHFDGTTIRLWYMGAPNSSLPTYGLAVRILQAKATNPDGPFTKDSADVISPSTSAAWDYGWLGGVQIRARPNGKFVMLYNAGNTRPATPGNEPNASAIGFAYSDSLDGPWTKDAANPYLSVDDAPTDAVESLNIWRGHLVYDANAQDWRLFYNTGGSGTEVITFARMNMLDYWYDNGLANGFNVQTVTTTATQVLNSRVNIPPGKYRINTLFNVQADGSGGTAAKINCDIVTCINGTPLPGIPAGIFVGSYAYENVDAATERFFTVGAKGYVDLTCQVTDGTPNNPLSRLRRLRILLQRFPS